MRPRPPPRARSCLGDKQVRLGSRALDILIALVDRPGELVGKEELIARVWRGTFVEEGNLKFQIGGLRRALGDGRGGRRYIATSPGQGYRFVAPVTVAEASTPAAAAPSPAPTQQLHNLPAQLTRLIGRADAVRRIMAQVQRHRLITVVGPGGIGKTSAALAAAEALIHSFVNGVWLVDLAPVANPDLVATTLASVLGFDLRSDDPVPGLSLRSGSAGCCWCSTIASTSSRLPPPSLQRSSGVRKASTSWQPAANRCGSKVNTSSVCRRCRAAPHQAISAPMRR